MLHALVWDDVKSSSGIELVGNVVCDVIAEFHHRESVVRVRVGFCQASRHFSSIDLGRCEILNFSEKKIMVELT